MALKIDTVAHACRLITREMRDTFKNLTVYYIVHHEGQRTEALSLAAQEMTHHPAAETAMHILQRQRTNEDSALLGTAVATQSTFFGLSSRDRLLAICTMNLDQFDSLKEARRYAYHLAWHAIDSLDYHSDPENRSGSTTEILLRRRNALEIAYANLRADVFSVIISGLHGDQESIQRMGIIRSINALTPNSLQSPEYFPFAIATESTKFAFDRMNGNQLPKKKLIPTAIRTAYEISKTFDEMAMEHWLAFSEPAQDMAWRGFTKEEILSAAINTSQNTYVRATGYLVSELTEIQPSPILKISDSYSPYADDEYNEKLHDRVVNDIFEDVIAAGLKQSSITPFLKLANQQNESLSEGKAIGWCASALQAAAQAYEYALANGSEPEIVIRKEFEVERYKIPWKKLKDLSDDVVTEKRSGGIVTMNKLLELCKNLEGVRNVQKSIEMTMNDPTYQQTLDAANELAPSSAKTVSASPNLGPSAGPPGPTVTVAPKAPGLGKPQTATDPHAAKHIQTQVQKENTDDTQRQGGSATD